MGKMICTDLKKLFRRSDWLKFGGLVAMMVCAGLLELLAIGVLPLFLTILLTPDRLPAWLAAFCARIPFLEMENQSRFALNGGATVLALFLLRTAWMILTVRVQARMLGNRQIELSSRLFHLYLWQPVLVWKGKRSGVVLESVFTEINDLVYQVLHPALLVLRNCVLMVFILGLLLCVSPLATLFSFCALGICSWIVMFFYRRGLRRCSKKELQARREYMRCTSEGLRMHTEALLAGKRPFFERKCHAIMEEFSSAMREYYQIPQALWPQMEFITVLILLGSMGGLLLLGQELKQVVPVMALLALSLARMKGTVTETMVNLSYLRYHHRLLHTLADEVTELQRTAESPSERKTQAVLRGEIVLDDVSFRYPGAGKPVLEHFSLRIRPGETVGIAGATGTGKSTLAGLILGLYQPDSGTVTVGGKPLREHLDEWQARIGYVPQELQLLDATIRENIAFAEETVAEERLAEAERLAQLHEMLAALPEGDRTPVGENGAALSGGQRQRIVIARALYRNPDVLVLDEATSALDQETEKAFVDALEGLRGTRTLIVIAHRQTTLEHCDRIVALKNNG